MLCELRGYLSCSSGVFFLLWVDLKRKFSSWWQLLNTQNTDQTWLQFLSISVCNSEPKSEGGSLSREGPQGQVISWVPAASEKRFWRSFFFFFFPGNQGNQVMEVWKLLKGFSESYFILFRKSQAIKKARNKKHSAITLRRGLLVWKLL